MSSDRGTRLDERLHAVLGDRLRRDQALGAMTTYRVGGRARWFVEVDDAEQLAAIATIVGAEGSGTGAGVDVLVVGNGSNLLVSDSGFDGLALRLGEGFTGIEVSATTVTAGAMDSLPVVARRSVAAGLRGFEWAVGVPGSIGGAVRMNAGGHGDDMSASLRSIRLVDLQSGEDGEMAVDELELGYRTSAVEAWQVVTKVELELTAGDVAAGQALLSEIVQWRRANQPGGQNAGSVFTNPIGDSAGRLIDAAGCKGLRVGTAEVSVKHANFIQSDTGGNADDVFALMKELMRRVRDHSGVELHPETRLIGFDESNDR